MTDTTNLPPLPEPLFCSWHSKDARTLINPTGVVNAFPHPPSNPIDQYWIDHGYHAEPLYTAAQVEEIRRADQAFFRFWYGPMIGDLMQPPLSNVDHSTARYIWNAAILAERERFRAMFDEALADHGITWPGEVDILYEKMFPAAAIREGVK